VSSEYGLCPLQVVVSTRYWERKTVGANFSNSTEPISNQQEAISGVSKGKPPYLPIISRTTSQRSPHASSSDSAHLQSILLAQLYLEKWWYQRRRQDLVSGGHDDQDASIEAPKAPNVVRYGEGCPLPSRLGGLGERRELPQRDTGRSPGRYRIFCIF